MKSSNYIPRDELIKNNMITSNVLALPGAPTTPGTPTLGQIDFPNNNQAFTGETGQTFLGQTNQANQRLEGSMNITRKIAQGREELKLAGQIMEKDRSIALL